ncbi:MAG: hypothetical protein QQW96_11090 [Tychonema bourrellyi B0820]|uniref:hypothetical protein n=1 Tax=Tychonema bourrellyi TaxID=54313 RepID=UPI00117CFE28|nr:hypothetical protein [Tychonema bourrellyi]MDQ2098182.1 hypothetical protein [Tychonema bourrellyi B0820]
MPVLHKIYSASIVEQASCLFCIKSILLTQKKVGCNPTANLLFISNPVASVLFKQSTVNSQQSTVNSQQ